MKAIGVVCVLVLLGAADAGATEIAGKWGIGAAAFNGGGELSLIRGHSARSAWLFDVFFSQQSDGFRFETTGVDDTIDRDVWTFLAGPGYRRFTRPDDAFSPYWDVRVRGSYARTRADQSAGSTVETRTSTGAVGEFSFGLEYFTRWHFSLAAHTGLARVAWNHLEQESVAPSTTSRVTRDTVASRISLNPVVYVRAYF